MVVPSVDVTPELAAELLHLNGRNRPISDRYVKDYSRAMQSGAWRFAGGTIGISAEGLIIDGQKRLLAIIDSGTTQQFNIQTGLDRAAFDVVDIGQQRTAADTIAVAGYKNYNVLAGMVKLVIYYKNGRLRASTSSSKTSDPRLSNKDVLDYIEKHMNRELMEESATFGNKLNYRAKFFSNTTYAAFFYLFAGKDRDAAILFFEMLTSGENISKTSYSMIFLLRNKLINMMQSATTFRTTDKYALLIKAWNYFRVGKEVQMLSWQPKEDFPVIQ